MSGTLQELALLESRIEEYKKTIRIQEAEIDMFRNSLDSSVKQNEVHNKYIQIINTLADKVGGY